MTTLRLIFYIVLFILGIILRILDADYRGYYDRRTNRENFIVNRIRVTIRRFRATRKCRKLFSKNKKTLMLKNSNVIFAYDTQNMTFVCINAKKIKETASVEWLKQPNYNWEERGDNTMEIFFDSICASFTETTSYSGIVQAMRNEFTYITESKHQQDNKEQKRNEDQTETEKMRLININSSNEENSTKS